MSSGVREAQARALHNTIAIGDEVEIKSAIGIALGIALIPADSTVYFLDAKQ
jgi:hypothetical protein